MNANTTIRNSFRSIPAVAVVIASFSVSNTESRADIVIDNFSSVSVTSQLGVGTNSQTFGPAISGVVGGANATRNSTVTVNSGAGSASNVNIFGNATFNSGATNSTFTLKYDANGTGLGSFLGTLGIHFTVGSVGLAAIPTSITVTLTDGVFTATNTVIVSATGTQSFDLSYGSFTGIGSVDLGSIASVSISVNPNTAGNIALQDFRTFSVPEPATMGIWSVVGLVGFGMRRRIKGLVAAKETPAVV